MGFEHNLGLCITDITWLAVRVFERDEDKVHSVFISMPLEHLVSQHSAFNHGRWQIPWLFQKKKQHAKHF